MREQSEATTAVRSLLRGTSLHLLVRVLPLLVAVAGATLGALVFGFAAWPERLAGLVILAGSAVLLRLWWRALLLGADHQR